MRASRLFFTTLLDTPAAADSRGHQLLLRAGYVRQLGAGLFDFLPLGQKVKRNIEEVIWQEMDAIGGQEVSLPLVQPAELWRRSGRWGSIDESMVRFTDRAGRAHCLAMTHEEAAADLARQTISWNRQLPALIYQFQTKFRDEARPRGGLLRVREFTMKDAYSFDRDVESLEAAYNRVYAAYERIFARCELEVIAVNSDLGMMGGSGGHEFMVLSPIGEDTLLLCTYCDYRANQEIASFRKPVSPTESMLPLEEVATPGASTSEALGRLLNIPTRKTVQAIIMATSGGEERLVVAVVRGDMTLNQTKLENLLGVSHLRSATTEEIAQIGAVPGYASPIGLARGTVTVVVDDAVVASTNLVAGANRAGTHLLNTNIGRDYRADYVADIVSAQAGYGCARCGEPLEGRRGVEVGHIFKLGSRYSEALGATFVAQDGTRQPLLMGSYGVGLGRVMACVAEVKSDALGLVWPVELAPFDGVITVVSALAEVSDVAEALYRDLSERSHAVLLDDREESPGVKFRDADLLGFPWRITLGAKSLEVGQLELKRRGLERAANVPLGDIGALERALAEVLR